MQKQHYSLQSKLICYPGMAAWHFLILDKKISKEIKESHSKKTPGFGSIRVTVSINKTNWKTSLFPSKEGYYVLPVKAPVRKNERLFEGDTVKYSIEL